LIGWKYGKPTEGNSGNHTLFSINAIVAEGNEWKAAFIVVIVYLPNNAAESFQTTY